MHAVRLFHHGKPLVDTKLPDPKPGPDEIAVEIRAAGICHSDAHYRTDFGRTTVPITLGHEIAGVVSQTGANVAQLREGDRVALHYLVSCGTCGECRRYGEQFCTTAEMLGKDRDGGFADFIVVPAVNAIPIPDEIGFPEAAVMMCSTATAFHALRLADVGNNDSVAVLGFGGLGASAVQLAGVFGAREIYAVDVIAAKLELAETFGVAPVAAGRGGIRDALLAATGGHGVDVAIDFTGSAAACVDALRSLAPGGRLMLVALSGRELTFDPYADVLGRERRIIGCSDHTREELVELMDLTRRGDIDLSRVITRTVPLEAAAINDVLDELDRGTSHLRTVAVTARSLPHTSPAPRPSRTSHADG